MDVYWLEQTRADLPARNDWLSAWENARLDGLQFPKRREDWRLGRWTAKRAVAAYLGISGEGLSALEIVPALDGAPEVIYREEHAPVAISISHSAGTALCAVSLPGVALGCDLEKIETHSSAFIADFFTAEEQALIAGRSAARRRLLVALLWSGKESVLKALRTGLRADTRSVTVRPADALSWSSSPGSGPGGAEWLPLPARHVDGRMFHGWWQSTGKLVRTLVASPPPGPPLALHVEPDAQLQSNQAVTPDDVVAV